jgi:hypothetical protein
VKRVVQRASNDCSIAVLAMLLDEPYESVYPEFQLGEDGLNELEFSAFLRARNCVLEQRSRHPLGPYAEVLTPFAPRHAAVVNVNYRWQDRLLLDDWFRKQIFAEAKASAIQVPVYHVVAVDAFGTVFDPTVGNEDKRALSHYVDVLRVIGIWRPEEWQGSDGSGSH